MNKIVSILQVFFLINTLNSMEESSSKPTPSNKVFNKTLYDVRSWLFHNNINHPARYLEIKPEYLADEKIVLISEIKFLYLSYQARANAVKLVKAINSREKDLSLERLNDPESIEIINSINAILKKDNEYGRCVVKIPAKKLWAMAVFIGYDANKKGKKCPFYVKSISNKKWKSVNIRLPE